MDIVDIGKTGNKDFFHSKRQKRIFAAGNDHILLIFKTPFPSDCGF